jgi:tetratricopeptide (TPR) repeat protein
MRSLFRTVRSHLLAFACAVFIGVLLISSAVRANAGQASDADSAEARATLKQGVEAYKHGDFDEAVADFKRSTELDPSLVNAQLYLGASYAGRYVPGDSSPDNLRYGEQAIGAFRKILENDPENLSAIDGIGSILYNMGGTPYDRKRLEESKAYHEMHIRIRPEDPEPYFWVGVVDWSVAYRANKDLRTEYNGKTESALKVSDPLPPELSEKFAQDYRATVDEGISALKNATKLRLDYADAMAYLNLLYRQKADMEESPAARDEDLQAADDLLDKVKAIKQGGGNGSRLPQP